MKTIKSVAPRIAGLFTILLLITSVAYPLTITGIAQALFPRQAEGSILTGDDGKKYGSALLAQEFTGEAYLWGRIMNLDTHVFTDKNGNPAVYAWASNKTPAGEELEELIAERVRRLRAAHPERADEPVPVDLVTSSGSGLDPEISPAAASYQIERIAAARNMTAEAVQGVIDRYTTGRLLGVFGEPRVNVLKVNLALDGILDQGR